MLKQRSQLKTICASLTSAATVLAAQAAAHPGHDHGAAVHAPADVMIGPVPLKIALGAIFVAAIAVYAFARQRDRS